MVEESDNRAVLSRTVLEVTGESVRLHADQVHEGGIFPTAGGEQHRRVLIGSCSCVMGSIFAMASTSPGTEIQGSINALQNVGIGHGIWVQGGVMAGETVRIDDIAPPSQNIPGHIVIDGAVSSDEVHIGDGALILGPVSASSRIVLGAGVTVRDHVMAPEVVVGDGCLIGGLIATNEVTVGNLCTVASSYLILPSDRKMWHFSGPIRSPDPGCDNCPQEDFFGTGPSTARKLACHLHAEHNIASQSIQSKAGPCKDWTPFPIEDEALHWSLPTGAIVVSHIQEDSVNLSMWAGAASRWERGGED